MDSKRDALKALTVQMEQDRFILPDDAPKWSSIFNSGYTRGYWQGVADMAQAMLKEESKGYKD